jgi:hypothetical protein
MRHPSELQTDSQLTFSRFYRFDSDVFETIPQTLVGLLVGLDKDLGKRSCSCIHQTSLLRIVQLAVVAYYQVELQRSALQTFSEV